MTLTVTILIGVGVLFIASALDDTPLTQTFQKIIKGQTIDWTGSGSSSGTTATKSTTGTTTNV